MAFWVASRIRDMVDAPSDPNMYDAIGVARNGTLIGGVIYQNFRKLQDGTYETNLSWAGERGWLTRLFIRQMFAYPFIGLNCSRMCGIVSKSNKISRNIAERLGFKLEGVLKGGSGVGRDAVLYGMTRDSCRWIKE